MKIIELQLDRVLKERGRSADWLSHQTGIDESALLRLRKQKPKSIQWKTLLPSREALDCELGDLIVKRARNSEGDAPTR